MQNKNCQVPSVVFLDYLVVCGHLVAVRGSTAGHSGHVFGICETSKASEQLAHRPWELPVDHFGFCQQCVDNMLRAVFVSFWTPACFSLTRLSLEGFLYNFLKGWYCRWPGRVPPAAASRPLGKFPENKLTGLDPEDQRS